MSARPRDLLSVAGREKLALIDAEISLWREFDLGQPQQMVLRKLIEDTPWRQEKIVVYGKPYLQPRLSAWYGDVGYRYSGIDLKPLPWTAVLLDLKARIETLLEHEFNSVLLNYYRDGKDGMGMHSDDERELGARPLIASLSLGEERAFLLKHRTRKNLKTVRLPLPVASLLVMAGDTQRCWRHGIAKEKNDCGPRVNLTFRQLSNPQGSSYDRD